MKQNRISIGFQRQLEMLMASAKALLREWLTKSIKRMVVNAQHTIDLVYCSLVFETVSDLKKALDYLQHHKLLLSVRIKNKMNHAGQLRYMVLFVHSPVRNLIAEIQLQLAPFYVYVVKGVEHLLYELKRVI